MWCSNQPYLRAALTKDNQDKYCNDDEPQPSPPKKVSKAKSAPQNKAKPPTKDNSRGVKRKTAAAPKKVTKRRRTVSPDEDLSSALSDAESEPPKKPARRQRKVVANESDEEDEKSSVARDDVAEKEDMDVDMAEPSMGQKQATPDDDSDMSSLIDESPAKKKPQKSSQKAAKGKKEPAKSKAKAKPKAEEDPNAAEIKRLQGWLVKCGIRKVWGKELANCDTPKDKIRHLKGMLSDAGMDGKYSVEKAARIKEQREFAKDLEEIQAGAAAWGKQQVTETGRPRRAANRAPPKPVVPVFSDDEDEEGDGVKGDKEGDSGDDDDDDDDDDEEDEDVQGGSEATASGADDDSD